MAFQKQLASDHTVLHGIQMLYVRRPQLYFDTLGLEDIDCAERCQRSIMRCSLNRLPGSQRACSPAVRVVHLLVVGLRLVAQQAPAACRSASDAVLEDVLAVAGGAICRRAGDGGWGVGVSGAGGSWVVRTRRPSCKWQPASGGRGCIRAGDGAALQRRQRRGSTLGPRLTAAFGEAVPCRSPGGIASADPVAPSAGGGRGGGGGRRRGAVEARSASAVVEEVVVGAGCGDGREAGEAALLLVAALWSEPSASGRAEAQPFASKPWLAAGAC